jgi:hypothetical protein
MAVMAISILLGLFVFIGGGIIAHRVYSFFIGLILMAEGAFGIWYVVH